MKLYCIALFAKKADEAMLLAHAKDVSSFGYFQRSRLLWSARQVVLANQSRSRDNTAGVVICDSDYPSRVAFSLIAKRYPKTAWTGKPSDTPYTELDGYLQKYQEADALMKVQKDLDETKVILHQTIESVLQRGEKMEDLVAKSDDLSSSSKMFYKQAKKANSCCVVQ